MSWKEYKKSTGKNLYTFMIHSTKTVDIIIETKKNLEKLNKIIKDSYKRKIINNRIYSFVQLLEKGFKSNSMINHIFLIGPDIEYFELSKNEKHICNKWNIKKYWHKYDSQYNISDLEKIFDESKISTVFQFENEHVTIKELDASKCRTVDELKIKTQKEFDPLFEKFKPKLIHGYGSLIKKINTPVLIFTKKLLNKQITNEIHTLESLKNHKRLDETVLSQILNPAYENLFLFGKKDVGKAIQNYMVKELFVTPKLLNILLKKLDNSYINFKITEIVSLEYGDIGDKFKKDFGGLIAVKYFAVNNTIPVGNN